MPALPHVTLLEHKRANLSQQRKKQKKAPGATKASKIDIRSSRLVEIYGLSVYDMLPKGYKNESHHRPSKELVKALCRLANVDGDEHPQLADMRCNLISATRVRRAMYPKDDCDIVVTDVVEACELREQCGGGVSGSKGKVPGMKDGVDEGEMKNVSPAATAVVLDRNGRPADTAFRQTRIQKVKKSSPPKKYNTHAAALTRTAKLTPNEFDRHPGHARHDKVEGVPFAEVDAEEDDGYASETSSEGFAPDDEMLADDMWLAKLVKLTLNNAHLMVYNRMQAVLALAPELHAQTFHWLKGYDYNGNKPYAAQMQKELVEAARDMVQKVLAGQEKIEEVLREYHVFPTEDLKISESERVNLLRHTDNFEGLRGMLDIKFQQQWQLMVRENGVRPLDTGL